jgi:GNAT superfamily N-acetyltransferase
VATSLFLHKLAVHPDKQGQGVAHALLRHAIACTRQAGRQYLRLDCMGGRPKLRAVYEAFGFRHHSEWTLGATVFHRFEFEVGEPGPST